MTAAVAAGRPGEARAASAASRVPAVDALAIGLAEAARQDGIWLIAEPAPPVAPAAILTAAPAATTAVVWEARDDGWLLAGAGAAAELRAAGDRRFTEIAAGAADLWRRLAGATVVTGGHAAADGAGAIHARLTAPELATVAAPVPRLFGGFAFAPGGHGEPAVSAGAAAPWAGFGDAWFMLPRWTYARCGDAAWLVLAVDRVDAAEAARWRTERDAIIDALTGSSRDAETRSGRGPAHGPGRVVALHEPDDASWRRQVEDIRGAIAAGRCDKVVAARASVVELADTVDAATVLARLGERHPDCTRFAVRTGGATFTGATPERLIRQHGLAVASEALAGSIARAGRDDATAAAELLASAKDLGEHELVVRAITDTLAPRCAELAVPAQPAVRILRHVLHMHTPVHGQLAAPGHILELVAALHPTPAVGGTPTAEAVAWIASHEPPRGWYAAPVGWFDLAGDGDFAVAIRSGLIDGRRSHVWAGAGIVRDSDAELELAEVRLKQRALLGALGVL